MPANNNQEMREALEAEFNSMNAATSAEMGITLMQSDEDNSQNNYEGHADLNATDVGQGGTEGLRHDYEDSTNV